VLEMAPYLDLELKVLEFEVPRDWATGKTFPGPHEALQKFLEGHDLWGDRFRYGAVDATLSAERMLKAYGLVDSQRTQDGTIRLYEISDSRDNFCNAGFFEGRSLIVVYDVLKLGVRGPRSYFVNDAPLFRGLVAIVKPI